MYFYILVSGHSCKQPRTILQITSYTFSLSLSSCKRTPERKSTTSVQYLVVINPSFYIAVRHNDFTVIMVPYFNVSLIPRYFFIYQYLSLPGQSPVSGHLSPMSLVAASENYSRKQTAPVTDIFITSQECPLTNTSTVFTISY